jgi:hypothetical protein
MWLGLAPAWAENRVALVIGSSAYQNISFLPNLVRLGFVILDLRRNDPFAPKMKRSNIKREVDGGFVQPTNNVLVANAAKDGTTAEDSMGRNGPFTAPLLRNIAAPDLVIEMMFRPVRDDVIRSTNNEQRPFEYGSLSGQAIYLRRSAIVVARLPSPATSGDCGSAAMTEPLSARAPCPMSLAEEHSLKPKDVFKECANCPEMVVIPAGQFTMARPRMRKGVTMMKGRRIR